MAPNANIKVVGVGGGGGNAVAHMVNSSVDGVEFITANTDSQAIKNCGAKLQLQLGTNVTKGLGAGANPEVGRQAALEDREQVMDALQGADMVFITAGMGGGTGTGAAPVVAQLAKEMGILTVAVVTKPFPFEGRRRMQVALKGIDELGQHCDSLITIPNEKLITVLGRNATMIQAFRAANDVLLGAVQGIADLIVRPGLINVDFADVRTVMSEMGLAMMGTGTARGDDRAQAARSEEHPSDLPPPLPSPLPHDELGQHCYSLSTTPNAKLITVLGRNATMIQAFRAANAVRRGAVQGIADLIVRPGSINVDFADVRTVMSEMGLAMMGTGTARGDDRAQAAAEAAIQNPLLDDVNLRSEEHTSELPSLMRSSYAGICLKKKIHNKQDINEDKDHHECNT